MGMFDYINCELDLPDGWEPKHRNNFQTKSLDNCMDHYTITLCGKLIKHCVQYRFLEDHEMSCYGTPEWEKPINRLIGRMQVEREWDEYFEYTGIIKFYNYEGEHPNLIWHTYNAKFFDGKLQSIEVSK